MSAARRRALWIFAIRKQLLKFEAGFILFYFFWNKSLCFVWKQQQQQNNDDDNNKQAEPKGEEREEKMPLASPREKKI